MLGPPSRGSTTKREQIFDCDRVDNKLLGTMLRKVDQGYPAPETVLNDTILTTPDRVHLLYRSYKVTRNDSDL